MTFILLLVLPLLAAPTASVTFPDTPVGRHASAWFTAFNGGEAEMRRFFETHASPEGLASRPVEGRIERYRDLRGDLRSITPREILDGSEGELRVVGKSENGMTVTLTFRCEDTPARAFDGVMVDVEAGDSGAGREPANADIGGPGPSRAPASGPPMTEAEVVAALRAQLDSLAKIDRFSGAALLKRGDRVLLRDAWGLASRRDGTPNRSDTKFNLGSINKAFTKVAIQQLVATGKLRLDDTVDKHLSNYPKDKGRKLTIAQLLEHRGGTGDIFNDRFEQNPSRVRTMADWMDVIRDQPLEFEPGARQEYSNAGYVLLGAIVEKVSGESYYDYVREHIFRPAGMRDTDSYLKDEKVPNRAVGYTRHGGGSEGWTENTALLPGRPSPAGGGYSTVDDLGRFATALQAGKLVTGRGEGLGVGGGAPGINAALESSPEYTLVVMANLDPPTAEAVAELARGWLQRAGIAAPQAPGRKVIRVGGGHHDVPAGAGDTGGRRIIRGGGPDDPARKPKSTVVPPSGVEVEMFASDHLPAVDVMINGQGPFRFAIDTGAGGTARIDSALAARLGLPTVGEVMVGDPSGRNPRASKLVELESLAVGGARFGGLTASVRDFSERRMGSHVDGILGFGLFADVLFTLDYPGKKVGIKSGELPAANGTDVLAYRDDHGIPQVMIRIGDKELEADLDCGAPHGFSLPLDMAAGLPLAAPLRVVGQARTVSNTFEVKAAELKGEAAIGRFTYPSPTINFQPVFPMANVGSRVIRDFRVTFDQKNKRMRLERKT